MAAVKGRSKRSDRRRGAESAVRTRAHQTQAPIPLPRCLKAEESERASTRTSHLAKFVPILIEEAKREAVAVGEDRGLPLHLGRRGGSVEAGGGCRRPRRSNLLDLETVQVQSIL